MKIILLAISLLLVSACSQQSNDLDVIESQCQSNMKQNDSFCECLTTRAEKELNADQIAFIAAGFEKDQSRIEELKSELGMEGILGAGIFMAKSVTLCGLEQD